MDIDDESAGYFPELIVDFAVKFYRYTAEFGEFPEENVFQLSFLCQFCDRKIGQFFTQSRFLFSLYDFKLAYFAVFRLDRFFTLSDQLFIGDFFLFLGFLKLGKSLFFRYAFFLGQALFFFCFFKFRESFFFR